MRLLLCLALCVFTQTAGPLNAADTRDQLFDSGWRFHRGNAAGAELPRFDDSQWRALDLPHDWSIEDLPPRPDAAPEVDAVTGEWRFHRGDDASWSNPSADDADWRHVTLPDNWENHSGYSEDNAYGWYRRRLEIPAELAGKEIDLLLGRIDDADEVWLNGQRIGGSGSFPPDYRSAWDVDRRYRAPAGLVRGDGSDLVAVRVFDGENNGGIYQAVGKSQRVGPFDPAEAQNRHFTAYTVGGIGWYRKAFESPEAGRQTTIRFDGVYMNAEVWLNGRRLGEHPHGYTGFHFDLTPHLRPPGEENVLAVRVRNEGRNSRWYSGSGIYRHVWLTTTGEVHIPTWGVFVTTPEVSAESASVRVSTEVRNAADSPSVATVRVTVRDATGATVGVSEQELKVAAGQTELLEQTVDAAQPDLWSLESPTLYSADVQVLVDGRLVDSVRAPFGVRKIEVDAQRGFRLNGRPVLLKGGCIHHDNGPLGAAAIDRAEERRVELLKANGFNAIRSSHNPPSPAMIAACDRLGVLMIVEAFDQWNESKENNLQDYHRFFDDWRAHDIAAMVRRDRNHPSVIMWSIGNEIPEQFRAGDTGQRLRDEVLRHDDTRPVTAAICTDWGPVMENWGELSDPAFPHLDVAGYNYLPQMYEPDHVRRPDRVMYGSESLPKDALAYWALVEEHPYVIGDFVWTALDYLGEAGIAHTSQGPDPGPWFLSWPWINAWCGDLDLCGFKKPQSFYRDVVWRRSPIELLVHTPMPPDAVESLSWWGWPDELKSWNWDGHEGQPLQAAVYSRCDRVRLELNGRVIGEQPVSPATKLTARFNVPYESGELKAVGLVDGRVVAENSLHTTGPPAALRLTADRGAINANRNDLSYVTVEVVDASGARVPTAEAEVRFTVAGVGELAGQANGSPNQPASFQAPACRTRHGRCLAILRPTGGAGQITLTAEADGLRPARLAVVCRDVDE